MGYKHLVLKLPVDYTEAELSQLIKRQLSLARFSFEILSQSLDARQKGNIHWVVKLGVESDEIWSGHKPLPVALDIPYRKRNKKIVVIGSGPAGFFASLVLQMAGFEVVLIEKGTAVKKRGREIRTFEQTGRFSPVSNYAFGEGGAGTFSDGKLTSRSKHLSLEKAFILDQYVSAGAPKEIRWLAHPHLGTDNLKKIVENLRKKFESIGGRMLFETEVTDMDVKNGSVRAVTTTTGQIEADYFVFAPGHSSYQTYRMLMRNGVAFRTKNFALGSRAEHPQTLINRAQWGVDHLPGIKAAEYRLTSQTDGIFPVYTFCMCPGGMVVPATPFAHTNIVNGMSYYQRGGEFANAACVAGIHPDQLSDSAMSPAAALDWLESLESFFYEFAEGYAAPFCTIKDFLRRKESSEDVKSSYPLGLKPAPLWDMLPFPVVRAMQLGLKDFSRKLNGYESGILLFL